MVHIHGDEESNEDLREVKIDELGEEGAELNHIKSFAIVHIATEDLRSVPQEVTDCLYTEPRAHECRTVLLIRKLEVVQLEGITKENIRLDNDSVCQSCPNQNIFVQEIKFTWKRSSVPQHYER